MKTTPFYTAFIFFTMGITVLSAPPASAFRLHDLAADEEISLEQAVDDLSETDIIVVGENHDVKRHHEAQLAVVKALAGKGRKLAVGLEMFSRESQEALDNWIAGKLDTEDFKTVYYENWNLPWHLYGMIFEFARSNQIPLVGLNVPRDITRKVARQGFGSLTGAEKGKLSNVTCIVDPAYRDYIRRVHGAHGHGKLEFIHFCEAQMVWDTVMAVHAVDYLKANPGTAMVLLTGSGHARKMGIPNQIKIHSDFSSAVILPEVPGAITADLISGAEADFIIKQTP